MHTTPLSTARQLWSAIREGYELPPDDYQHHQPLRKLKMAEGSAEAEALEQEIEDTFLRFSKGGRNEDDVEKLRHHWRVILKNLSFCMYQLNWLLVSTNKNTYTHHLIPRSLGLSYNPTVQVLKSLEEQGLIVRLKGKRYENAPVLTRIYPTAELMERLWQYFIAIEEEIEPPYLFIKEGEHGWEDYRSFLPDDHYEVREMEQINEFLKGHDWACKGPVTLRYKHSVLQGGRLYNAFQALPDRRMRIRINTTIDGKPIGEVDFSANHLRLNLAYDKGVDAGATPYEDIGEAAGGLTRVKVKDFITVAMGADDIGKAASKCGLAGINRQDFQRLTEAANKVFPDLDLFTGWGIHGQNYEGQILKQVMLEGIKKDIVCLPVHDAVAVQQEHLKWAEETMLECWDREMRTSGLARVKVDLP